MSLMDLAQHMLLMSSRHMYYLKTCQVIESCLDIMLYALCFRCGKDVGIKPPIKRFHHCGRLNNHLKGLTNQADLDWWLGDIEHGLFHGMSVALLAGMLIHEEFDKITDVMSTGGELLLVKEKNLTTRKVSHNIEDVLDPHTYSNYKSSHCEDPISFEQLTASCLLHDFARCKCDLTHDVDLRKMFPDLMEVTYSHSSPADHNHPLLIADVLELRRYQDHASWYDPTTVETSLSKQHLQMINCYFACIRPSLEFAYKHRLESWVAHGPEVEQSGYKYPQHPCDWVAIETDRVPFSKCFIHDHNIESAPWGLLRGALPWSEFKRLGGMVGAHKEFYRDHLYANIDATTRDWLFVTNRNSKSNQQWVKTMVSDLVNDGCKVVELSVLNKFIEVTVAMFDRVQLLAN